MSRFDDMLALAVKNNGKKHRARPRYEEDKLQMSCITWFDYQYPALRILLHHSPNEGKLPGGRADGAKRKAMGMRAGFPDLVLLYPSGGCPFLCIELKTDKGRQEDSQKEYQKAVEKSGGRYVIVRSLEQFIDAINTYLKMNG